MTNVTLAQASSTPFCRSRQKPRATLHTQPPTRPLAWLLAAFVLLFLQLTSANAQLTVTVSGITNPSIANGTYTQDGTYNGRPEFFTSNGEGNLYWDDEDNEWELYYWGGSFDAVIFSNPFNSLTPPCTNVGTWTAFNGASGTISLSGDCGTEVYSAGPNDAPNYTFTATTRTYAYLSGGTAIDDIETDDEYTGPISLPFAFTFSGQSHSEVYVSSNGWITFEDPEDDENSNYAGNIMSSGMIFPLWDDIGGDNGNASYQTTGTAPNRIFKIEWRSWAWDYDADPNISFQLWLYEGTNVIEFVYKQEPGGLESTEASIGIATNSVFFKVLEGTGISPSTSSDTFYDELYEKPATDQVYRFTPPGGGGCTAPTAYNLTGGGLYCPGSPVAIGLSSSESGVTYQLVRNGSDIGSPVGGTGSGISFAPQTTSGTYTVVATRTGGGCTADMSGNASVNADNTPPAVTCPGTVNANTSAGGTGDCSGIATWTTPTPTDNCSATIQSVSHAPGSAFAKGSTTVTYIATDLSGNTASCAFTVNVSDDEAPSITCPDAVTLNTTTGQCTGTTTLLNPTVTDNCSLALGNGLDFDGENDYVSVSNTLNNALVSNAKTIETWVKFAAGYNYSGTQLVGQVFTNGIIHFAIYMNGQAGSGTLYAGTYAPGWVQASTTIPAAGVWTHIAATYDQTSIKLYINGTLAATQNYTSPLPINTNGWLIGKRWDVNPGPSIVFKGQMDEVRIWNSARTQAEIAANMYSELVGNEPALIAYYNFNVGTASGTNTGQTTLPDLAGTADNGTLVDFSLSGSTSNWVTSGSIAPTNNAPTTYPVGQTTVTWTVSDASFNTASCNQIITVNDNQPPAVTCPATVNVNTSAGGTGDCSGIATWTTPSPTDNCTGQSIQSVSHNSGSAFAKGSTTVTYVAVDAAGNTSNCTFTVNVADNEPPTVICPASVNITTSAGGTGNCAGTATWGVPTVTDNCGGSYIQSVSHPNSSAFPKGTTTITYTAIDAASNTSTCTFTVNVTDDEPPAITCPGTVNVNTSAGGTGDCSGIATWTTPSPTDNCTGQSIQSVSHNSGSAFAKGSTTVTYVAIDAVGNTANCTFTVNVDDDENPVALCRDRTVALDINGAASLTPADVNNGSSDNCTNSGTLGLALDDASYDCAEAGQRTLTLTVTDEAGNTAACNATLTVLDVINHAELGRRNASDGLANDKFGWGLALDGTTLAAGAPEDKVGSQNKQGSAYIFDGENGWSQAKHLKVAGGAAVDYFANALALDGNTLLAGAHGDNIGANADQGSAYIFEKNLGGANNWGQRKQLFDPAGQPYDYFANSVSLKNGRALIGTAKAKIGATAARGCAYIFEKDLGGTDNWGLAKKLMADDGAANNFFGNSVAQADDIAVVGANGNSNNRGAAYIFAQDFGGTGNWGQAKKLMAADPAVGDGFGTSVSVSGDFVLVGAPNKGTYMGAAYIFLRDAGGTDNWGQVKKLHATDCATNDRFGTSVVLDGDYAYVSAVRCGGSGAVYIFHRNAGGADNWGQLAKHTPSDGAANDQFGSALSVSGFNFAASSSLDDVSGKTDQGSAYVFEGHDCGDDDRPEQTTTAAHSLVIATMPSVVCSPNPFRDALTVQIGAIGAVRLQITDATGRIVEQAELPAGTARFDWQATGQPTGLYFVQVAAEDGAQVVPVSLMR